MPFRNNPYGTELRSIFDQLQNPKISFNEINASRRLFDYSSFDPVSIIERERLVERIPNRVCIIGGGIAGLTAAFELSRAAAKYGRPKDIRLYEQGHEIGGRIRTHRFTEHAYSELGPMRLPAYHRIALHYIRELNLGLQTFPTNASYKLSYSTRAGRLDSAAAGRELSKAYRNAVPTGYPDFGTFFPSMGIEPPSIDEMEGIFLTGFKDRFSEFPEFKFDRLVPREDMDYLDLFSNRPLSERGQHIESITVRQGFMKFVAQQAAAHVSGLSSEMIDRCGNALWEIFARATGIIWLEHISMAHFMRETQAFAGGGAKFTIKGGFSRLTEAFVSSINDGGHVSIHTGHRVTGVRITDGSVELRLIGPAGQPVNEAFDRVICAIPASATALLKFDPALDEAKRNALLSISYLAASKSAALFKTRFWETDTAAPQRGGVTYTNLENQQMWYPHDNLSYEDGHGPDVPVADGHNYSEHSRKPIGLLHPEVSHGPGAVLLAYMWGDNARRFNSLPKDRRDEVIAQCLDSVYPGASRRIDALVHHPWDGEISPGGGAFAWFQPGQQTRYQEAMTRPHPTPAAGEARVYFAGEHLGLIQGWIQSAMTTALDAVLRVCGARRV